MSPLARMCATRGCTQIIITGTRCPTHATQHYQPGRHEPAKNQRPHTQIYKTARWKQTRLAVLERDHWTCTIQHPGCTHTATIADHYPVSVLETTNPYDPAGCRAACRHCSGVVDGKRSHQRVATTTEQIMGHPATATLA
jgi:hypothetical protein